MGFDPYSQEFFEDPWDTYRWMRDEAPVFHHPELEFYAESGAPEGALYVDGELVGYLPGITRL